MNYESDEEVRITELKRKTEIPNIYMHIAAIVCLYQLRMLHTRNDGRYFYFC
jgi:hypothetical protein